MVGRVRLQTSVGLVCHQAFHLQVLEAFVYLALNTKAYLNAMKARVEISQILLPYFHSYEISV